MRTQSKLIIALFVTLSHLLISIISEAQAPQAIPYQAIARDVSGNILANQAIALRITLIDSNINTIDFQETHTVTTNSLGLITLNIGQGTPIVGTLAGIYWPISGNEYVQVEMDPSGGTNYVNMGITKLNSVPFALHANTSSDNKWSTNGNAIYNKNLGNVGIGTSTPNAPLQFSNANLNRKVVLWDGNNDDHQFVGLGTSPGILRYQVDVPNSNHVFYAGSSSTTSNELMRISGNGNVGIGTASPSAKLDVNGVGFFRNNLGGSLDSSAGAGIKISTENNIGNIFGFDYSTFTPIDLVLQGEGANVGIGNHFPESTLQITKPNDATTLTIGGNSQAGQFTALRLQTSANQGGYSNIQSIKYSGYDYGDLILNKDGGNVGLGTASPSEKLDVNGTGKFGSYLKIGTDVAEGYFQNSQDGAYRALQTGGNQGYYFQNYNGVNTSMYVGLNGLYQNHVGIGNAIPQHALNVGEATTDGQGVMIRGYGNSPLNWKGGAAFGYTTGSVIMGELNGVPTIGGHDATLSAWNDLSINPSSGNVGIGTQTPTAKLDIEGTLKITDGTQGAGKILTSNANGMATWANPAAIIETDPKVGSSSTNKIPKWNGTAIVDGSLTDDAGNIGLGTTAPAAKLDVVGNVKITDGTQSNGRVLTSDANGLATWQKSGALAYGMITGGNTLQNSFGISNFTRTSAGNYSFTLTNTPNSLITFVGSIWDVNAYGFISYYHSNGGNNNFIVRTRNPAGVATDFSFSFVVYCPN